MSNMGYIHAALILHELGKEISKESIINTLKGAGIDADPAKAEMVATALQGVNIEEVLKAAAATQVAVAAAPAAGSTEAKKEA
ncbi:MAG: 50S ribosomal protein P1, partial [Candidatus Micrarchaeia archaeon]